MLSEKRKARRVTWRERSQPSTAAWRDAGDKVQTAQEQGEFIHGLQGPNS